MLGGGYCEAPDAMLRDDGFYYDIPATEDETWCLADYLNVYGLLWPYRCDCAGDETILSQHEVTLPLDTPRPFVQGGQSG